MLLNNKLNTSLGRTARYCSVLNCNSVQIVGIGNAIIFHKFPIKDNISVKWLKKTGLNYLKDKSTLTLNCSYRVCSLHFEDTDYINSEKKRLKKFSVPSLFYAKVDEPLAKSLKMSTEEMKIKMEEEYEIDIKDESLFDEEIIDRKPQVETVNFCEAALKTSGDVLSNIDQRSTGIIKSDCVYIKCEENLDLKYEDRIASEESILQKDPLHFGLEDYSVNFVKHSNFTALVKKQPTVCLKRLKSSLLNRLDLNLHVDLTSISEKLPNPAELNNRISNNISGSDSELDYDTEVIGPSNELQLEENLTASHTNLKSTNKRLPKTCPVCKVNIVGLAAHLRTHDIPEDEITSICFNMKRRPARKNDSKRVRVIKTCPLEGCEGIKIFRLDLHLRARHGLSPKDDLYRKFIKVPRALCPSQKTKTKLDSRLRI